MSGSVRPHRQQPTRLPHPWDSPGKNTGVGCHFLLLCMKVKSESEVAQSVQHLATPLTAAYQAAPSMGFSRQEYWSRLPFPTPNSGILLTLGSKPHLLRLLHWQADSLPLVPPGKPKVLLHSLLHHHLLGLNFFICEMGINICAYQNTCKDHD